MNTASQQLSRRQRRLILLVVTVCKLLAFSSGLEAQVATIDLSVERDFVYQDGVYAEIGESILPFAITLSNPGANTLNDLEFSITLTPGVSIGNVDSECTESEADAVVITCSVDELKSLRSKVIDFYVDGPNSLGVGEGFEVSIASSDAVILEPDAVESTLADGDRRIRGSNLFVHLVRNIDLDIDQNGVPDLTENILGLADSLPIEELLERKAVVDVLFIATPAATQYLGTQLEFKADQILGIANQVFRENGIAIVFNRAGLEEIPYTRVDTSILTTFDALVAGQESAFSDLDELIVTSGGDIVVMMHALDSNIETECGWTTLNGVGRQGDFQTQYHQGELLSVINVGPDCLLSFNLAPVFASNMGIARERQRNPNGGTFSYSAAYGLSNSFYTLGAAVGTPSFASAAPLNRFSNPDSLCLGVSCGVDRADIANGADAVYSLNKTRHLISAISPSVSQVEPESIEEKIVLLDGIYDLEVVQSAVETSAIMGELTEIQLSVTNTSAVTLSDIELQFAHVNAGSIVEEAHLYETSSSLCTILGSSLAESEIRVNDAIQKTGTLSCTLDRIAPGESVSLSYRIQVDLTPPVLNIQPYYHEVVMVNGIVQLESLMCIPVFQTFVEANEGSSVCSEVENLALGFGPQSLEALDQVPTVTGNRLSIPYIRLDDGGLVSAEFRITYFGAVRFELLSYQVIDSSLTPQIETRLSDAGVLSLPNILVGGINYDIEATIEPGSDPVTLGSLVITALSTNP